MDDISDIMQMMITVNSSLAALTEKVNCLSTTINTQLSNHESRLTKLEVQEKTGGLKSDILALAVKGLVISICALGTLAGAGTIIAKALGM